MQDNKKEIRELINGHIRKIRSEKAVLYFQSDPVLPNRRKENDQKIIKELIAELEHLHGLLFPFIKKIKQEYINDITEQTLICAVYLLFCHVFETWEAIFLLAKNGFNTQMNILLRHIRETLDLIDLFIIKGEDSEDLRKWFSGDLIPHKESRKAIEKFEKFLSSNQNLENEINLYNLQLHIYTMLSQYPHSGYCGILESVDPFNKDFDFQKYSSFHFTKTNISGFTKSLMDSTIIAMKFLFQHLKDLKTYKEIDKFLNKDALSQEEVEDLRKRFPKN